MPTDLMPHCESSAWAALVQAPVPPNSVMPSEQASSALWRAVNRNDKEALLAALQAGASPKNLRDKQRPLARAVELGHWDVTETLIAHGASLTTQDLWESLIGRDDPAEAERLKAWGAPLPPCSVWWQNNLKHPPLALLGWHLGQMPVAKAQEVLDPIEKLTVRHVWFRWLAIGPQSFRERCAQLWALDPNDPLAFVRRLQGQQAHPTPLTKKWMETVYEHVWNATVMRELFASGFGVPGLTKDYSAPKDTGWMFVGWGVWSCAQWWRSVPELARHMDAAVEPHPKWWHAIAQFRNALEGFKMFGLWNAQAMALTDEEGNTALHALARAELLSAESFNAMVADFSEALDRPNHAGETPRGLLSTHHPKKAKALAKAFAKELSAAVGKPNGKTGSRARL